MYIFATPVVGLYENCVAVLDVDNDAFTEAGVDGVPPAMQPKFPEVVVVSVM